jgi:hypothetical protein
MNGLRVYTSSNVANSVDSPKVFYSRRGAGPYYVWQYDSGLSVWKPSRITTNQMVLQTFNQANLKSLPDSLKAQLTEHYLE